MGRKHRDDAERNGVAVMEQPAGERSPPVPPDKGPGTTAPAPKNRPVATFAAMSDRTTRIEVAVWAKAMKTADGEAHVQFATTCTRSWKDKDGHWTTNGFYRVHDVPVQTFLIQHAYQWCLLQRTDVRIEGDDPLPF